MECVVKPLRVVKSHWFETCGDKQSIHVKGWCGSGQVRSPGDFEGLYAIESWFISHMLVQHVTEKLTNKKNIVYQFQIFIHYRYKVMIISS